MPLWMKAPWRNAQHTVLSGPCARAASRVPALTSGGPGAPQVQTGYCLFLPPIPSCCLNSLNLDVKIWTNIFNKACKLSRVLWFTHFTSVWNMTLSLWPPMSLIHAVVLWTLQELLGLKRLINPADIFMFWGFCISREKFGKVCKQMSADSPVLGPLPLLRALL